MNFNRNHRKRSEKRFFYQHKNEIPIHIYPFKFPIQTPYSKPLFTVRVQTLKSKFLPKIPIQILIQTLHSKSLFKIRTRNPHSKKSEIPIQTPHSNSPFRLPIQKSPFKNPHSKSFKKIAGGGPPDPPGAGGALL